MSYFSFFILFLPFCFLSACNDNRGTDETVLDASDTVDSQSVDLSVADLSVDTQEDGSVEDVQNFSVDSPGIVLCDEGDVRCGSDGVVEQCQGNANETQRWVVLHHCPALDMPYCVEKEGVIDLIEFCVNECGGRGFSLQHKPGDRVDSLYCAEYVCSEDGHLEPDRCACSPLQAICTADCECVSGNCTDQEVCMP